MPNIAKPRTKTFTGCWTCRDRRVKCDDEHPHCRRCRRSGWVCKGYGLRLGWDQSAGRSHRRQLWSLAPDGGHGLSSSAVSALLAELDGCSGDDAQQRGPFSVFSVLSGPKSDQSAHSRPSLDILSAQESEESHHDQPTYKNASSLGEKDSELSSPCTIATSTGDPSEELGATSSELSVQATDQSISLINNGSSYQKTCNKILGKQEILTSNLYTIGIDISLCDHINPIRLPRPETELVHHWVVFLSGNMLLIDAPDNLCRTAFMPLALKGLDASPNESNIHLSVFHAICAASAFSLFHLRRDPRYQSLAMHHDQLALRHLRGNLQRARGLDEPTLAAVLTCITAEAMSGRRSRWRAHVAGCLGLLESQAHSDWIRNPIASRLLQSYLSLSSLCSLRMSERLMSLLDGSSDLRHYLERSHGITAQLVQLLAQITVLVETPTQLSIEELDRLEVQVYLNFPCLSDPDAPGSMIVQHALNSFYYALVVYFRRNLRHASLSDVQDLIEKAICELESVDKLTREKGGCSYNWASFVVAADCERPDLQDRMLAFFDRKSRHGIQNINVLCEIVQVLWNRRTAAGPHVDIKWQELAREADFDIMLV
ncbi:unnamed protein product [Penicillium salamii]|nr:unnamed protein product [Penicillium salamii]CAG8398769.1 unnamed protein product [Penicillium salamii]